MAVEYFRYVKVPVAVHAELVRSPERAGEDSECSPGVVKLVVEVVFQKLLRDSVRHLDVLVLRKPEKIRRHDVRSLLQVFSVFVVN